MAFAHLPTHELPQIKQINIDGKRHYETPHGTFISITTLLSSVTPQGILDWRESVGDDVADYAMRIAAIRGNKLHKIVELYLSNEPQNDLVGEHGILAAGLFSLMRPALDKINKIRALEQALYSANLGVAGRTDCIADFDGELSTIDFKTTSKMRDEPSENYLLQATFYATAWEEQTGERIKQIVIITGAENGQLDVKTDDPSKYTDKLKKIIEEYKA